MESAHAKFQIQCTQAHVTTTPLEIYFVYLGNKEIYCTFSTCCTVSVLFSTKCHLFQNFIFFFVQIIFTFFIHQALKLNPLNAELNLIWCLLALLGAHHFLHVSRIRVKSLTLRLLMSYIYIYIYGAPILDVSRSHTTMHHSR